MRLYKDKSGRIYGKRTDETVEGDIGEEPWFVYLPPTPEYVTTNMLVEFPTEREDIDIFNMKTNKKLTIHILMYPERVKMGDRTASVNVLLK
jgi:hypothetical protein